MAAKTQYVCDGCGAVKGETNHWYSVAQGTGVFTVRPWSFADKLDERSHFCGASCVQKALSKFLVGGE